MRVIVIPPVPALLPEYASLVDPVADLRVAIVGALSRARVTEVWAGDAVARRVGEWAAGRAGEGADAVDAVLLLANGSARRTEKAPGHLDERSFGFDADVESALTAGDADALAAVDQSLAADLLADLTQLPRLAGLGRAEHAEIAYADDPYGVRYWVAILDW